MLRSATVDPMTFSKNTIKIDAAREADRIADRLRRSVRQVLRRSGAVLGISGGVDSSVVLALCVRAFGPEKVTALILPEKDSNPESEHLARVVAAQFGITPILECITPALDGYGCYVRRDEAIRRVFPEYSAQAGYKAKIVLDQNLLESDTLNVFSVTVITPDGREMSQRLAAPEFLQIVAASNFKQRTRMATLYYHAELRNYAVIGTANKNEVEQGFFVKHGDSGVDVATLRHLYKSQIYQLAEYLNIPEAIQERTPTSDTYSAPCSQQEFFFRLPFEVMDLLWYAMENKVSAEETGAVMGLTPVQVQRVFNDFERKHRTTAFLRMGAIGLGETDGAN